MPPTATGGHPAQQRYLPPATLRATSRPGSRGNSRGPTSRKELSELLSRGKTRISATWSNPTVPLAWKVTEGASRMSFRKRTRRCSTTRSALKERRRLMPLEMEG